VGLLCCFCFFTPLVVAQASPGQTVGLRILVVDSPAEAQKAMQRLQAGEEFGAVAKQVSTDITAPDGGYMGQVDPGTLRSELRDALQGVAVGQVTAITHVPSGYAILKVLPVVEASALKTVTPAQSVAVNAAGGIRYAPNVAGKAEADFAYRTLPKPDGWNQDLRMMCQLRQTSLATVTDQVQKLLDPSNPDSVTRKSSLETIQMHYALANIYAYKGEMAKAVAEWETAYRLASTQLPGAMPELEEVLGIAYLHKSEMDNDVYRHPGDRCLFPPKAGKLRKYRCLGNLSQLLAQVPGTKSWRARREMVAQSRVHDVGQISWRRSAEIPHPAKHFRFARRCHPFCRRRATGWNQSLFHVGRTHCG
jgi:hypothetical protein